jgi:hypothetical protein
LRAPLGGVKAQPTHNGEIALVQSVKPRRTKALAIAAFTAACTIASSTLAGSARTRDVIPSNAQGYQSSALWLWQETVITDPSAEATFFAFVGTHGVRRVYVECESAIQTNQPALIRFLEAAASHGMVTELLFGDPRWVLPGKGYPHQGYAVSLVATFTKRLLRRMNAGKPVAVHFDVEPYSLARWRRERNAIALDYIGLVTRLAGAAHSLGLTLSVDVPYWYSTIPVTRGSVTTPMNQLVIDAVDGYVIMDYWDTSQRVASQATTDLTYADGRGKDVVIGVLTTCGQIPADTSFCNATSHSGTAWMESVLRVVTEIERPHSSFTGAAIEDYAGFSTLGR